MLTQFGSYMYGLEPGDMARCRQLMEKTVELARQHGTADQQQRAALQMRCFEWYEAAAVACGAEIFSAENWWKRPMPEILATCRDRFASAV